MAEYIIKWNAGYGNNYECVEVLDYDKAMELAYEAWKEDVESNADYNVVGESTDELKAKYGL